MLLAWGRWVTSRITDTFFALHPEQRVYQDSKARRAEPAVTAARSQLSVGGSSIGATAAAFTASAGMASAAGASGEVVRPDLV